MGGVNKRQQVDVINTEEHQSLINDDQDTGELWHPCNNYFNSNSKTNWPDFTTKWDLRRLLQPQTFIDAYKAGKDFKDRNSEKGLVETRDKREDDWRKRRKTRKTRR